MGVLNQPFLQHRSKIGSKRPFGLILPRFWRVLEGFWENFRRVWSVFGWILEGSGKDFGNAWRDLALLRHFLQIGPPR